MFDVVSAYKDPVEIHRMKNLYDKIITGFFVFIFGILWFLSTKYFVKPEVYEIIIYDVWGNESKLSGIRTKFRTPEVAQSYIKEYQRVFPHLDFSIQSFLPEIKKRIIFSKVLKNDHR